MTPENFCYWLSGVLETQEEAGMSARNIEVIRRHLALVMTNITADEEEDENEDLNDFVMPMPDLVNTLKTDPLVDPLTLKPFSGEDVKKVLDELKASKKKPREPELVCKDSPFNETRSTSPNYCSTRSRRYC